MSYLDSRHRKVMPMISHDGCCLPRSGPLEPLEPIPISALQHWAYCPRQCGLIHLDQAFDQNLHTRRGNAVHRQVDQPGAVSSGQVRIERALPLWHDEIGLIGKADVVEFDAEGAPYPVEYKQGSRSKAPAIAACDDLQLAAQVLCLEQMTGYRIKEAAFFYARSKRRRIVPMTDALRQVVPVTARAVREMLASGALPPPLTGSAAKQRCGACSLNERCLPEAAASATLASLRQHLFDPDD
ncbi:MAG: CRISPR-associated protein Cas4 [Burkholderiaceae bacterium]